MPKGKTNAPLNILVIDGELYGSDEVQALKAQGHNVEHERRTMPNEEYDRIYGLNCYRMTTELLPFLTLSLKEARLEKKQRTKEKS